MANIYINTDEFLKIHNDLLLTTRCISDDLSTTKMLLCQLLSSWQGDGVTEYITRTKNELEQFEGFIDHLHALNMILGETYESYLTAEEKLANSIANSFKD